MPEDEFRYRLKAAHEKKITLKKIVDFFAQITLIFDIRVRAATLSFKLNMNVE